MEIHNKSIEGINLEEMARIGYTADSYEVYVNTDDGGNIPHFHYRKGTNGSYEFHTCIRIDKAEYFHHTGKEEILSSSQRKELVNFLNTKPSKSKSYDTNWDFVKDMWNANNYNVEVDLNQEIPDYINLK